MPDHFLDCFLLEAILILSQVGVGGWTVGKSDNKANSVQLLLQLPAGTELGNKKK